MAARPEARLERDEPARAERVANPNQWAMEALVEELARAGVRDACVCPGHRSAPLAFALARASEIRLFTHVDERSAGFFALGLARSSRRPVVVACTSGSAVANLLPAVVEAHHAAVPMILLTADRPPELRERSAPQTIDQIGLFGARTRWAFDLGVPTQGEDVRHFRAAACRAVGEAWGPPAGVVHLNLPLREPLDPSPDPLPPVSPSPSRDGPFTRACFGRPVVPPERLGPVVEALERARRPLVHGGVLDEEGGDVAGAVAALARRLGAPVLAEPVSNLRRPALADWTILRYEALLRSPEFARGHEPDLVIRLGRPPTSRTVATWLDRGDAEVVVIGDDSPWADPSCRASHLLRAGTATTCSSLERSLGEGTRSSGWCDVWRRASERAERALAGAIEAEERPFEGHVVRAVARVLGGDGRLYVGNSLAVRDLDAFWPADVASPRIFSNRGANGIDGFVSSVLGAAGEGGPVLGLCGDLSFLHDLGGLLSARRLGVRACFVVVNNGGGGIFDFLPVARAPEGFAEHYEQLFVTPPEAEMGPLVRACGVGFERISSVEALEPAVERAWRSPTTAVVEVAVDRRGGLAARERVWAAVRSVLEGGA